MELYYKEYIKDIKGYEGLYAITNYGRIYSYKSKKFLSINYRGFNNEPTIGLSNNGARKTVKLKYLIFSDIFGKFIPETELPRGFKIPYRDLYTKEASELLAKYNIDFNTYATYYAKSISNLHQRFFSALSYGADMSSENIFKFK